MIAESLTNVAKYAQANAAQVSVTRRDGVAVVVVEDDGVGGADATRGSDCAASPTASRRWRSGLLIESSQGGGTRVRAEIPIASAD